MKYEIKVIKDKAYVWIQVYENITVDIYKDFAEKSIQIAKEHRINKYLVDVREARLFSSALDQYRFGYEDMENYSLGKISRIAVLVKESDNSHDFIETIFINAGYSCRLFIDADAAIKWLTK
ncbi:STAS/SEC14 domain-containing protein [Deltaproteobacteria bacterium IMCC39524]|nr:STAS/SEC14 domain-containing protein [Deltaproteobacteria bacterium IMCC39524]